MPDGTPAIFEATQRAQTMRRAPIPRLPDQLSVNFGPAEAIGRVVLATDFAVRNLGIRLSLSSDFEELADINRANRRDWYPLMPNFDPRQSSLSADNAFWLKGVDAQGDVVLCHAVRLYAFAGTSFKEELESLRFYYGRPAEAAAAGLSIEVTAPAADRITGRVSYSGALWVRSDFRGGGLARLIPPLSRVLAVTRWYPAYHTCILMQPTVEKGMAAVYGYDHLEYAIWVRNLPGFGANLKSAVCWKTTEEATREIEQRAGEQALRRPGAVPTPGESRTPDLVAV